MGVRGTDSQVPHKGVSQKRRTCEYLHRRVCVHNSTYLRARWSMPSEIKWTVYYIPRKVPHQRLLSPTRWYLVCKIEGGPGKSDPHGTVVRAHGHVVGSSRHPSPRQELRNTLTHPTPDAQGPEDPWTLRTLVGKQSLFTLLLLTFLFYRFWTFILFFPQTHGKVIVRFRHRLLGPSGLGFVSMDHWTFFTCSTFTKDWTSSLLRFRIPKPRDIL